MLAEENAAVGRAEPFSLGMLLEILRKDPHFREYMFWMGIYGGGNLMLTSQLVVIFSEQLHLAPGLQIALLSVVPLGTLPLFVPFWARMFDRGHIVEYRARQGWSLVLAVATLSVGTWFAWVPLLWLGAVLLGAAYAGANLGWNLGHNDFASVGRAQHYMGVHVTLTGVRGAIGPPAGILIYQWLESWRPGLGLYSLVLATRLRDGGRGRFFAHAARHACRKASQRAIEMKSKKSGAVDQRKYSRLVVDGAKQSPSRAMLRAVGFQDADFQKPQIGVASTWASLTPCNIHINDLATEAIAGADCGGRQGRSVQHHHRFRRHLDGLTRNALLARFKRGDRRLHRDRGGRRRASTGSSPSAAATRTCPGCAMAIARLNRPAVFVYGGTIKPGAKRRDIVSVFEAVGGHAAGRVSDAELLDVERTAIPGPGSCGGMYTANTMASAIEALGLSLPNSSAQEAVGGPEARRLPSRRRRGRRTREGRHQAERHPHEARHSRMRSP